MARQATKKQRGFARDYVDMGNGTQAALKNYDTQDPEVAKTIASENLTKPNVRELIENFAEKAAKNVQRLADTAENETVRLNANKDVLDRAGYKAPETTISLNIHANPDDLIKHEALRAKYEKELLNELKYKP